MENHLIPPNIYEHYEECPVHEDASGYVCSECGKEIVKEATYCAMCDTNVTDFDNVPLACNVSSLACSVRFSDCICEALEMEFELSEADRVWSRMKDENEGWE